VITLKAAFQRPESLQDVEQSGHPGAAVLSLAAADDRLAVLVVLTTAQAVARPSEVGDW
jgi:hypothetical protein